MHTHRSIAVEGVGFGHRVLATLGFWGIQIQITTGPSLYGGGTSGDVYYLIFNMNFYGKKIRKSYALTSLDIAIKFVSKLFEIPVKIKTKFVDMITINRNIDINLVEEKEKVININVDQSELKISIKRK